MAMLAAHLLDKRALEERLVALGAHAHDGSARAAFAARLDNLLPQQSISTKEFARTRRKLVNPNGEPFDYDPKKTPYADGIADAMDHRDVRIVAVKGNTRSAKTVTAENFVLNRWTFGPLGNVIWFAQDEDSINDYIDERGEEMLRIHPEVNARIDWTDRKNGRKRKKIGRSLLLYRPATMRSTRMKAAPTIVADEIDAYQKKIRDSLMTLVTSRQEEFGNAAKAYLASHPDAGPDGGIDAVLKDSLLHLWFVQCPHCGNASSPAAEAVTQGKPRINWNVPELMAFAEEMERVDFLNMVAQEVRLVCPHDGCHATFDADQRIELMNGGRWLQPHQTWEQDGTVTGESQVQTIMGFVIHAFMAPFVKLRETARDWAAATLTAEGTAPIVVNGKVVTNDTHIREVTVKKLGETFMGTKPEEQIEDWRIVQARLATRYDLKTVPAGVRFITAFIDIQGDRFEVRVIGWNLQMESWLIDAYSIKQWPAFGSHGAFDNIDPGNRLTDWDILEEAVLASSYPLAENPQRLAAGLPELFMPIAKTCVDAVGVPGVTNNARIWLANLLARDGTDGKRRFDSYRIQLVHGSRHKTGELYGKPSPPVLTDDRGRPLLVPIRERQPNVHDLKRLIARRMKISEPGPGMMHMPDSISARYAQELTAERFQNGTWIPNGTKRNETWDGWVMCEVARALLQPDRPGLWDETPEWAMPRPRGEGIDSMTLQPLSYFDRLAAANRGE
jgi:phage terminase large subunit GpA-like protein